MQLAQKSMIKFVLNYDNYCFRYTPACVKLIAQYKTCINSLGSDFDIKSFIRQHDVKQLSLQYVYIIVLQIKCPAAVHRLIEVGIPATTEHVTSATKPTTSGNTKDVVESVQVFDFIVKHYNIF